MKGLPHFSTRLTVTNLNDCTWEVKGELIYSSVVLNRTIVVPSGFITDFASVPRVPIAYLLAGGRANAAAVIHDFLYQHHLCGKSRADRVFLEAMKVTEIPRHIRWIMYSAVVVFGWAAYASGPDRYMIMNTGKGKSKN